ncbi:MAG: hypothetical protein WBQ21_04325 [Solirubrobacteraceae bacterium]
MSTLLLERPPALEREVEQDSFGRSDGGLIPGRTDAHGGLTLDDLIISVWEGLALRATVSCPVCDGPMMSDAYNGHKACVSACLNCGSRLS